MISILKIQIIKNDKTEYIEAFEHIDVELLKCKTLKYHNVEYLRCPMFFDTETAHTVLNEKEVGWIYQWCFDFQGQVIIGRKPTELVEEWKKIYDALELSENKILVCYAHNLSYDIVYLLQYLIEAFGQPKVLALKPHKILSVKFTGLEFRCSYILSNMSLDVWSKKVESPIRKLVGAIDYDSVRYQDSELTDVDWSYMVQDVLCLKESLKKEMILSNDTIATIPLTSTGFVRRDCREMVSHDKEYRKFFKDTRLDVDIYKTLKKAFGGGDVHGNRFYRGKLVVGDIEHYDFKSHYPSVQELCYFPVTKFALYYDVTMSESTLDMKKFNSLCKKYCVVAKIAFKNLRLKKGITAPVLSEHKLIGDYISYLDDMDTVGTDNGRILNMVGTGVYIGTELDFKWIFKQYTFGSYAIMKVYISERGKFPKQLKKVIFDYFTIKETLDDGIYRDKSKNKLNAIYGMTATDIVRDEYELDFNTMEFSKKYEYSDEFIEDKLNKYYSSRNSFMPYQFGVYTTAHARDILHTLIECVGYENFLYCDTDSIFFKHSDVALEKINEYNKRMIDRCMSDKGLHVLNKDGNYSCFGTFVDEKENIKQFKFLHAKCYAIVNDSRLHATIAGVARNNKKLGDDFVTINDELQSIDNLRIGYTFKECGSTCSSYQYDPITQTYINGHLTEHASSVIILPTTKELGNCVETLQEYDIESEV